MRRLTGRQRGFTLIEMVTVIVLLGVIGSVLVPFMLKAMSAYRDSQARADLVAKGRLAVERLAREVRLAVPNTLEVLNGGQGIQFLRSRAGGRYVERFDNFGTAFSQVNRRFRKNANLNFGLYKLGVDLVPGANDWLVIGNTSPADIKGSTASAGVVVALSGAATTTIASDGTDQGQILAFGGYRFLQESPGKHFHVADQTVEVGLSGTSLRWHSANGLTGYDNGADWGASDPLLVDGVTAVTFSYAPGTPQSTGVLRLDLQLSDDSGGSSIRLYHEVHVRNTP